MICKKVDEKGSVAASIDLRRGMWLRKCRSAEHKNQPFVLEIATPNCTWLLGCTDRRQRNVWFENIEKIIGSRLAIKTFCHSNVDIYLGHSNQILTDRLSVCLFCLCFQNKHSLTKKKHIVCVVFLCPCDCDRLCFGKKHTFCSEICQDFPFCFRFLIYLQTQI